MTDKKQKPVMPWYDHWLDGVRTDEQLDAKIKDLAKKMQEYCGYDLETQSRQYAVMTQSERYHGAEKHLHRTDRDDITRRWDENGRNNHFHEDMDEMDLQQNTMSMLCEFAPEIIRWRMLSPDRIDRLKLVMPIDDFHDRIGSGFNKGQDGALHKWSTNAQTVILEKTRGDKDDDENVLGFRIITEFPCLATTDSLLRTINITQNRRYHEWDTRDGHLQQIAVKGVSPDDEDKIAVKDVSDEINPDDIYHGVARSHEFRRRHDEYMNAKTQEDKDRIERSYEAFAESQGTKDTGPDIRGVRKQHRTVPGNFEEITAAADRLDAERSRSDAEKDG